MYLDILEILDIPEGGDCEVKWGNLVVKRVAGKVTRTITGFLGNEKQYLEGAGGVEEIIDTKTGKRRPILAKIEEGIENKVYNVFGALAFTGGYKVQDGKGTFYGFPLHHGEFSLKEAQIKGSIGYGLFNRTYAFVRKEGAIELKVGSDKFMYIRRGNLITCYTDDMYGVRVEILPDKLKVAMAVRPAPLSFDLGKKIEYAISYKKQ
jgi:hypothetical protein